MKSEVDFINEAKQYRLVDTATLAADFKRIYTEGRGDQNEADCKAADGVTLHIAHVESQYPRGCPDCISGKIRAAIRAAGPGEGE